MKGGAFFSKNGGLNGCMITVVLLKSSDNNVIKKGTAENEKNWKFTNIHPKNDVLKSSKSQRYSNYYGLRKSRVGAGMLGVTRRTRLWELFQQKVEIPGSILAPCEIRRVTKNRHFQHRSALFAPKVLSGRGSKKNMKNQ